MYKKSHFYLFILAFIFGLLFNSCSNPNPKDYSVDPAFKKYISAFTSGEISSTAPIKIKLAKAYTKKITPNMPVKTELFSLSPAVKGKAIWINQYTIEFIPAKKLASGKTYWVKFSLGKIMNVESKFSTLKFPVTVIQQALNFEKNGLKSYSNNSLYLYQLKGEIYTADAISNEELHKFVKVKINGKEKMAKWESTEDPRHFTLIVDSINRTKEEGKILITWKKHPYQNDDSKTISVSIPPLGEFSVLSTKVNQSPKQYITIQFSDPLLPDQDLTGLIEIKSSGPVKTIINANEIKVYPSTRLEGVYELMLHRGIKNIKGKIFGKTKRIQVKFQAIKPAVKFVGKGNILPSSNNMIIPFEAVNLKAVDVKIIKIFSSNIQQFFQGNDFNGTRDLKRVGRLIRKKTIYLGKEKPLNLKKWNRFNLDLSHYIKVDQGAIYRIVLSFRKYQSLYPCDNVTFKEDFQMDSTDWDANEKELAKNWGYINDWNSDYYENDYFSGYRYSRQDNPCSYSYYRDKSVAKNVFASDIGIVAKKGANNRMTAIITNIVTTHPIENATVSFYDYQQQLITKVKTNEDGIVQTKKLPYEPFFISVTNQNEKGYLRLGDGNALPMSNFAIDGQSVQDGIKGFIYAERGVWRPGDTLFINFILEDKNNVIPDNHPVIFELYNARGQLVKRTINTHPLNGFYNFTTPTESDAPTGNWTAKVEVGGSTFTKTLKVETIKPNRLKINLTMDDTLLSATQNQVTGKLNVAWLHGAPARDLKTDISVKFVPTSTHFKNYKNYTFDDPGKSFHSTKTDFIEQKLDHEGNLSFSKKLAVNTPSPGMLKAIFTTRAYEEGGNFSIDRKSINYAPYDYFVGMKLPKTNNYGALQTDSNYRIPLVTVNKFGKRVGNRKLSIKIYRIDWSWWWENGEDNVANYVNKQDVSPYSTTSITTDNNGKALAKIKIPKQNWGRYFIRVTDINGGHSSGMMTYFDWPSWMSRAGRETPGEASMLVFSSDKKNYKTGENAKISFPSSKGGRALISLETGSEVVKTFWIKTEASETKFEIPITPELAPNFYVNITFIQPHIHTKNDAPIRMYGVIPIMVKDPKTILQPEINMPDVLRPNKDFTVKIKEKNNKAMTYTIAVVDEGLLSLTNFKTPSPWNYFYAKEALGVNTWDLYNYVIGAYGGKVENILTIGGDKSIESGEKKPLRFKPMVRFIGPFELKAGETAKHKIHVPNYIGAVRTMVVAGQDGAYGNAEKSTPVRTPLMVLATLPRVLGPEETVQLPVNLFAMNKKVKQVKVRIKTNDKVSVIGASTQNISFNEIGNKVVNFKLAVGSKIGSAHVEIIATSGREKSTQEIDLQVRQPNLPVTVFHAGSLKGKSSWDNSIDLPGIPHSNSATLELSSIPPINLEKRMGYLTRYPHGCIEQKTSGAFPQLYLSNLVTIDAKTKQRIGNNVRSVINRIQRHQVSSGGFSFWEGGNYATDWGTTYAGDFLLEAEKKGYALPYGLKTKWIAYQRDEAKNWASYKDHYYHSDLAQAYRLYTLALAGKPLLSAMNRLRHLKDLSIPALWRLAAAYQIIGKSSVAQELVNNRSTHIKPYTELSYTYGNQYRDEAMIVETLTLMGRKTEAAPLVKDLSQKLSSSDWMSTQTTAYSLMAISKFIGKGKVGSGIKCVYTYNGKSVNITSNKAIEQIHLPVTALQKSAQIQVSNEGDNFIFARLIATGTPLPGNEVAHASNIKLNVVYKDMNDKVISVDNIHQGMDFYAEVTVYNPGLRGDYKDLALSQLFPSGWEIRNQRMDLYQSNNGNTYNYQDIRDDRVYTYFSLNKYAKKTIRVNLHASFVGAYYLPAVHVNAMYDNSISALIPGKKIKVVIPGN